MKNKLMLPSALAAMFVLVLHIVAPAQNVPQEPVTKPAPAPALVTPEKAKADAAWKKLGNTINSFEPINGVKTHYQASQKWDGAEKHLFWKWWDTLLLRYREEGLKFWKEFPNDQRRYIWLGSTVWIPPFYWKDPEQASREQDPSKEPIDEAARKAWDDIYLVLRAEYMSSPLTTEKMRADLQWMELYMDVLRLKRLSATPGDRPHLLSQYMARFLDLDRNPASTDSKLIDAASVIFAAISDDVAAEAAFIKALKMSPRAEIQIYGYGRDQVAKLRSNPFEMQVTTMTGDRLDVAKLRGKVVLVDVWSNWCSSCIEAMPKVQAVYDKYRDRGFEVVGVWLTQDETAEKPQAIKILKEQGVTWPNGVLAGPEEEDFRKRYSITGVPVTLLLDQNGKLVTNDVRGPKLEVEVKRLVGL